MYKRQLSGQSRPHGETSNGLDRVIASPDLGFAPVDDAVRRAFQHVLHLLTDSGTKVTRDNPGIASSVVTWAVTATRDMWEHKQDLIEHELLGDHARGFMEFGAGFSDSEVEDARQQRAEIHDAYMDLFKRNRCNILLTPTLGCEAFHHGAVHPPTLGGKEISYPWLDWAGFLYDANLAGLPACSIPMGVGDNGLPLGLQVMGPPGSEWEVLQTASKIESLIGFVQPEFAAGHYLPDESTVS